MKSIRNPNLFLFILPVLIFSLGYVTILSTSPERAKIQLIYFLIGYGIYILVSFIDVRFFRYYWKIIYIITLLLLFLTYVAGDVRFGASRWFNLGLFVFQPSEFAKITMIIVLSSMLVSNRDTLRNYKFLLKTILVILSILILVFIQPDLGTTLILLGSTMLIFFYAGLNKVYFLVTAMVIGVFSRPIWSLLKAYQKERILVFLNPALDVLGSGYNVIQAQIAVGSGGFLGKGFGHGTQSQYNFLPAHWTDFAFASFAEEWGFLGVVIMMILYTLLLAVLLYAAYSAKEAYGALIALGVFTVFLVQFIINLGMNLGVLPVTGIPLPLVSYGGSSLLSSMILIGLVQSVWSGRKQ